MGRSAGRMMGFPNASKFTDPWGKVRWRYRKKGQPTVYLPGLPGSPEFAQAYEAACNGRKVEIGARRTVPGSVNALAVAIYDSAEWAQLATTTQTTYRGIIERLRSDFGDQPINRMTQANILTLRDKKAGSPTAANNMVKVLRWMMGFAVARQWRADNPAIGIKPLKIAGDGHHTWTEAEIAAFEKRWPVGTRERTAFDLLLYTAQRSGDVRQMGRQHVRDGWISVRQEKTDAELDIPIHPRLAATLATVPNDQMLFLTTQAGVGFTAAGFGNFMRDASRAAGLVGCPTHGLRKAALTRLADAGASEQRIMSVSGHKSPKEVTRYTAKRDQRRLAAAAMALIGGTDDEQKLAKDATTLAKISAK